MNPIGAEFLKIAQNIVRILLLPGLPVAFILIQLPGGFNALKFVGEMPIWAQILVGALFGGFIFTPANNIGNSFWTIITLYMKQGLNPPGPKDKPYSEKALKFAERERNMRRASIWQVSRELLPGCAKIALIPTVPAVIPLALVIFQVISQPSVQSLITLGVAIVVLAGSYIGWVLGILIPFALGIKLHYHN